MQQSTSSFRFTPTHSQGTPHSPDPAHVSAHNPGGMPNMLLNSPVRERTGSGGSKSSLNNADADATRSVHSMGMESERSAASTILAEVADGSETTAHLDNLMGLNERGLLCSEGGQQDLLEQLMP